MKIHVLQNARYLRGQIDSFGGQTESIKLKQIKTFPTECAVLATTVSSMELPAKYKPLVPSYSPDTTPHTKVVWSLPNCSRNAHVPPESTDYCQHIPDMREREFRFAIERHSFGPNCQYNYIDKLRFDATQCQRLQ